jgi:phosphoribosyl-AMP cyclohydrolase
VVAENEEGLELTLDFTKLDAVAATGHAVVPVVLQHADTGDVLFIGYANREALAATLDEGRAVLWSTSRNELWRKGETSGDVLELVDLRVNCEQNSVLYRVRPVTAGVCHTSGATGEARPTCYYRQLVSLDELTFVDGLA